MLEAPVPQEGSWVQVSWVPDDRFPPRLCTKVSWVQVGRSPECPVSTTPGSTNEPQQGRSGPRVGTQIVY